MKNQIIFVLVIVTFSLVIQVYCQGKVETADDGQSGTIKFTTPDLNDEESHSPFMPSTLKCDACKVVAYQLSSSFDNFNEKHKSLKNNIPESDVIEIFEETCANSKTFESYGLKKVGEVHRLSGPGTESAEAPGIMAGGGKWPGRLMDMCEQYMGEIGEMEIYEQYKKNPKDIKKFQKYLCYGKGIRGECLKEEDKIKQTDKQEL